MFYFVLGCSLVLLLITNLMASSDRKLFPLLITVCIIFIVVPAFPLMLIMPPFMKQSLALGVIAIVCVTKVAPNSPDRVGPVFFLIASCLATLLIYVHAAVDVEERFAQLRAKYPFSSIEDRLPIPDPSRNRPSLTAATSQRLTDLETRRDDRGGWGDELKTLHENSFTLFVDSPGFGYVRLYDPTWWDPDFHQQPSQMVVPQPNLRDHPAWSLADLGRPLSLDSTSQILLLDDSVLKFATDGYVKDRRNVAGFIPHGFHSVPQSPYQWKVASIELMSLLMHPEPVVYISKNLPRMSDRGRGSTRPLDSFETYALGRIRQGEYLVTSPTSDETRIRMLGAIYSIKRCVKCHGGKRGDLLGAFSYDLELDLPPLIPGVPNDHGVKPGFQRHLP